MLVFYTHVPNYAKYMASDVASINNANSTSHLLDSLTRNSSMVRSFISSILSLVTETNLANQDLLLTISPIN